MNDKSALIVDDSRTAQLMLQKMLEKQALRVDTADSAEAAIEYLARHAPDAIFMDHMMPGMNGFQAVKVIKQNPVTATIPIVMYTSKGGEVYVSQARALGAVGVLSKDVRPSELNRVLQQLRLVHTAGEGDGGTSPATQNTRPTASAGVALTDLTVRKLARATADAIRLPDTSDSLHDEIRSLRAELRQAMEASAAGLQRDIASELRATLDAAEVRRNDLQLGNSHRWRWVAAALCVGLGLGLMLSTPLGTSNSAAQLTSERNAAAQQGTDFAALDEENSRLQSQLDERTDTNASNRALWLETVSWAFNDQSGNDFSETPLDDRQLERLSGLTGRLSNMGFRGTLTLDVHLGDFCLQRTSSGNLTLPPETASLDGCAQLGFSAQEAELIAGRQSIAFANFVSSSPALSAAGISIEFNPIGNREPRTAYPTPGTIDTAGAWNRVARHNQRIELHLQPSADSTDR